MAFFSRKQKRIAKKCSSAELNSKYVESEQKLKVAASTGSEKELKKAMAEHRNFEYAKLYQNTPQFNGVKAQNRAKKLGKYIGYK